MDGADPQPLARRNRLHGAAVCTAQPPDAKRSGAPGRCADGPLAETLDVCGMMRNRCLARAIADAGWGELRRRIAYKAQWAQRTHIEVDRWFPSTKRCSGCHAVQEGLTLADRHWRCEACGAEHDRDVNAARNLEQGGLRLLTGQRPAGPGRLMRVEGNTPGPPPARSGSGSVPDEARTDSTRPRRYGTAEAA